MSERAAAGSPAVRPAGPAARETGPTAPRADGTAARPPADPDPPTGAPARRAPLGSAGLVLLVLLTALTLVLGYANKARCTGPEFDAAGRSAPDYALRQYRDVCYSDIQKLWLGRDVNRHVFPYVHGSITPDGRLQGGAVEYPVLTGTLMWLGALGASTDAGFLLASALILAPFGLVTGWMLGRLARWRALLWALGPPLVLYAFHNWDLPAVACAVGAVFVLHGLRPDLPLRTRATAAAVLLGLGFAVKLYPGAFLLPLALFVLTRGRPPGVGLDVPGAIRVCLVGALTAVAANLPFAVLGFPGWMASFSFQQQRPIDVSTNSIWFWGVRPLMADLGLGELFPWTADVLSPALVLLSFAVAAGVGLLRWRHGAVYPWIGVSGAMLCGFLLLHKVHSPQYTLWLLPFLVLLRVRWGWIAAYLAADALIGVGIFRWFFLLDARADAGIAAGLAAQSVVLGVWGKAVLLAILFVLFLRVPEPVGAREPDDGAGDLNARRTPAAPSGPPASDDRAAAAPGPGTAPPPSERARSGRTAAAG